MHSAPDSAAPPDERVRSVAVFVDVPLRYDDGVRVQERLVEARQQNLIPDTVFFLQHRPVITLGRRGRSNFLLADATRLASEGIDLVTSSRGGDVTFHGPGQLVIYPILKLERNEADAHRYLEQLEEVAIRTAGAFGVEAFRRPGMNGAWTGRGKFAAIGFHLKRWVSMHGMSFNVDVDLASFQLIVGCGLVGERVTSLREMLGSECPTLATVRGVMAEQFSAVMGRPLVRGPASGSLLADLLAREGLHAAP